MSENKKQAFTIIELLVVIAMIGLLAGLIVINLNNAKENAEQKKAMEFAHAARVSLGSDLVGEWTFDDGTAKDTSGNGNNGVIYGATSANGIIRGALSFDGNDYINCGNGDSLKLDNKSFTLEAWIKPSANIATGGRFTVMAFYSPGWIMDLPDDGDVEGYRFYNGTTAYKYNVPGNLVSLSWTHFVVTRDFMANRLKIYINGEEKKAWSLAAVAASSNPLLIGKRTDGSYFRGLIDEIKIYNQALGSGEIQKHYVRGAVKHNIALK